MQTAECLKHVRHIALDLDGTIYQGSTVFPQAIPFLAALSELGIGYSFMTNNSSRSTQHHIRQLHEFGISANSTSLFTSTAATVDYLHQRMPDVGRLFVLGTDEMQAEISEHDFTLTNDDPCDEPDAVVVGFDTQLAYNRLCRAAYWITQGKPFIATHPDRICPTDEPTLLVDCGSICAALERATGRQPKVVPGKPDRRMLDGLMRRHRLHHSQVAMVGDRLYTDMAMARAANVTGILVLTGDTTANQAATHDEQPDLVVEDLGVLENLLRQCPGAGQG